MREHGADIAAYDTTADAFDLVAVRQALGLAQWDVWGVSYGTRVAFELMRHDPAGIRSVVMEAAVPPEAAVFGGGLKHDEGSNNALLLSHLCRDEFPFEPMAALRHPPAAAFDGARSPLRELVLCPDWAGSADATVNMPVESDLPVLFLSGAYDVATPTAWSRAAMMHLPNAYLIEFPDAAHGVLPDDPCGIDLAGTFLENPSADPRSGLDCLMPVRGFSLMP